MARRERTPDERLPEWDDGRTIADMNVEGMPWYRPDRPGAPKDGGEGKPKLPADKLSRREMGLFTWGAVKAALVVVGVMCVFLVLFVLFCQHVWFR